MSCKPSASPTCHEAGTASPPGPRACRSVPSPGRSRWPPCCCSVADHDQDWWARGQAARTMPGPCQPGLPALRTSLVGTAAARVVPARTAPKADIACRATAEPARPMLPSSSADQCPARRRRVKGALWPSLARSAGAGPGPAARSRGIGAYRAGRTGLGFSCLARLCRRGEHRRQEDLHIICTRSASFLHTRELRCWVTRARARRESVAWPRLRHEGVP